MGDSILRRRDGPPRAVLFYLPYDDLAVLQAFVERLDGARGGGEEGPQLAAVNAVANPEAAAEAGVAAFPTIVTYDRAGVRAALAPPDASLAELDQWLQGHA